MRVKLVLELMLLILFIHFLNVLFRICLRICFHICLQNNMKWSFDYICLSVATLFYFQTFVFI